ncbi:MAG TPA: TadE family protein [Acetobacteraceae bacterium]|jgi:Flp pilus assembly protein TadG|nr:TadE family protein [Acetobacteraceae bacterium]
MSSVSSSKRRAWLGKPGTSSIELAFILPAFLWLLLGTIDIARYLYTVQALVGLMGEAGRVATMGGNFDWGQCSNNWWPQIATIAPLLDANNVTLCVTPGGGSGSGPITMNVQVSYPFTPYTPGLGALAGPITEATNYTY